MYTVKKAERDAGPKHEGDGKFLIHVERSEKSVSTRDWTSVTEFSVTLVLWSCVTLGFSTQF
jgi:hypothetical protein